MFQAFLLVVLLFLYIILYLSSGELYKSEIPGLEGLESRFLTCLLLGYTTHISHMPCLVLLRL